jgi:hypothetical protein
MPFVATQFLTHILINFQDQLLLNAICCYPIFDPYFDKFSKKNQKKAKNNENPKKCIFDIFASF